MPDLAQRCGAEFIGTFLLVFVGVGAIATDAAHGAPGSLGIALTFGAVVAAMVYATGHISGAHLNPAVTLGFVSAGRMSIPDAVAYVCVQMMAAGSASLLLDATVGLQTAVGVTTPAISLPSALAIEATITFALMFVIMAVATDRRASASLAGVAIGLAVMMGALMAGPLTGGSMNPARSFGPSLATGEWTAHWLYWLAPCAGALLAVRSYLAVARVDPPAPSDGIVEGVVST